ncbi:MAG: hypothetical protein WAQ13_05620, partial [Bacilli bacterium]
MRRRVGPPGAIRPAAIRKLQRFVTRGSQEKGALSIEVVNIDNRKNKTNANLKEVHGNQRKSHLIRGFP